MNDVAVAAFLAARAKKTKELREERLAAKRGRPKKVLTPAKKVRCPRCWSLETFEDAWAYGAFWYTCGPCGYSHGRPPEENR